MTVAELIAELQKYRPECIVVYYEDYDDAEECDVNIVEGAEKEMIVYLRS